MKINLHVENENKTCELARLISKYCFKGMVIALNGDLGAGKTRFCKALGESMQVKETITSPTFNILKCYDSGLLPFYHIDAYRLEEIKQDLGLEEYIEGDGVCLIEWASFIDYLLPSKRLDIEILWVSEKEREFVLTSNGEEYDSILKELVEIWK